MADPSPVDAGRQDLLRRLTGAGVRFVVVGGAAIQTHGIAYRTEDIDITPETSLENLQRLADVLNELGCSLAVDPARPELAVELPPGYITPQFLRDAHAVNLRTPLGHVDLTPPPTTAADRSAPTPSPISSTNTSPRRAPVARRWPRNG